MALQGRAGVPAGAQERLLMKVQSSCSKRPQSLNYHGTTTKDNSPCGAKLAGAYDTICVLQMAEPEKWSKPYTAEFLEKLEIGSARVKVSGEKPI